MTETALVTGGARGIGCACALALADSGGQTGIRGRRAMGVQRSSTMRSAPREEPDVSRSDLFVAAVLVSRANICELCRQYRISSAFGLRS